MNGPLGLKEMGKFLWEGREISLPCWLSQFSSAKLRQPTGHAKKNLVFHFGVEHHASFPQKPVVNVNVSNVPVDVVAAMTAVPKGDQEAK